VAELIKIKNDVFVNPVATHALQSLTARRDLPVKLAWALAKFSKKWMSIGDTFEKFRMELITKHQGALPPGSGEYIFPDDKAKAAFDADFKLLLEEECDTLIPKIKYDVILNLTPQELVTLDYMFDYSALDEMEIEPAPAPEPPPAPSNVTEMAGRKSNKNKRS